MDTINRAALVQFIRAEKRAIYRHIRETANDTKDDDTQRLAAVTIAAVGLAASVALHQLDRIEHEIDKLARASATPPPPAIIEMPAGWKP